MQFFTRQIVRNSENPLSTHPTPRDRFHTGLRFIPAVLVFLILAATGWWGIDYGYHWDELQQFLYVERTLDTGTLLGFGPDER